jgi:transcriptional regulator with XRE-family HTH domain
MGSKGRTAVARFEQAYGLAMQVIERREALGLTQAELAEKTGVDQADISRVERGSGNPTERTLVRLADALGAEWKLVGKAS